MKKCKDIFIKFLCVAVVMMFVLPGWAADNGCDNEYNDMITAELALCSVHAYNIGSEKNPETADRELMKEVIAMKSTFFAQQMYKQYEQMDSMLRRLKTQLKKAILTNDMKAAGAGSESDDDSSTFRSNDHSIKIAGAQNCLNEFDDAKMLECYQKNINLLTTLSNNGSNPTREMKQQLAQDYGRLAGQTFGDKGVGSGKKEGPCGDEKLNACDNKDENDKTKMMTNKEFSMCLDNMRSCMQQKMRDYKSSQSTLQMFNLNQDRK